jgi:hypothetical protein
LCLVKTSGEIGGAGAGHKVTVGIMAGWQRNRVRPDAGALQALRKLAGSLLAGMFSSWSKTM